MTAEPRYGHLVVIARSGADGKAFPMHSDRVVIGRQETCDIRMQRPEVSKQHCTIRVVDNKVVLRNLSENGTAVNARVLGVGQQATLGTGDVITVVGRSLRYEAPRHGPQPCTPQTRAQPRLQPPNTDSQLMAQRRAGQASARLGNNAPASARRLDRRQLSAGAGAAGIVRPARNPETARKLKLWHEHYSAAQAHAPASAGSAGSAVDLRAESPPPQLYASNDDLDASGGGGGGGTGLDAPADDVFAGPSASGTATALFRQMTAVATTAEEPAMLQQQQPPRDTQLAGEVARIMDEINRLAHAAESPRRPADARSAEAPAERTQQQQRQQRRRSRSLPRALYPPLQPQRLAAKPAEAARAADGAAYGSEDETSRATVGVSPSSSYARSPTLLRQRQTESPENRPPGVATVSAAAAASFAAGVVAKGERSPAEFFARLRRPPGVQPASSSSPLKRTVSSGGRPTRAMSRPLVIRPSLSDLGPLAADAAEASDDVPTEPEPDSDGDGDGHGGGHGGGDEPLVTPATPRTRSEMPASLVATPSARKSVRFGPALSPEVFDARAPPSTPLRRGTPLPIARASSILRLSADAVHPPTPHPAVRMASRISDQHQPQPQQQQQPPPPQLVFRSLLQPRDTRRREVHRYLASLAALDEHPSAMPVPVSVSMPLPASVPLPLSLPLPATPVKRPADAMLVDEPAVEIVEDGEPSRPRRRRSVRLARGEGRRATLAVMAGTPVSRPSPLTLPQSPVLVVRTCAGVYSPIKEAAEAAVGAASADKPGDARKARRERRRTAPAGRVAASSAFKKTSATITTTSTTNGSSETLPRFGDFSASIAAMAAALGEDVPTLPFAQPKTDGGAKKPAADAHLESSDSGNESEPSALPLPESLSPLCEHPLGLADAMHMQLQLNDAPLEPSASGDAASAMPVPAPRPASASRLSSSETLLLEQARLQARLINPGVDMDANADPDHVRRSRRSRRQTTSVLETLSDVDAASATQQLPAVSTTAVAADNDDTGDDGVLDTDDLLARRQRLRRMQERKRRRQTIAELKKRRSSWRGWMPAAAATASPANSPLRAPADLLVSSPPRSPSPLPSPEMRSRDRSANYQAGLSDADLPVHVPASSRSQVPFASRAMSPRGEDDAGNSEESSSFASSLNGNFNSLNLRTRGMYPPPLWNTSSNNSKHNPPGSLDMAPPLGAEGSPTKKRRLADYVAGAFGLRSGSPSSAVSAVNSDSDTAKHAYPPRPQSIDADWEHVDASAIPTSERLPSANILAAAEITTPAAAANEHGLIAVGRGDDLDEEIRPHMSASLSSASESLRNSLLASKGTALPAATNVSAASSATAVKPRAKPSSSIALHMQKRPSASNITSRLPSRQNSAASIGRINSSSSSSISSSSNVRVPVASQKKSDSLKGRQMQQQQQQQQKQKRLPEPKAPRNRRNTMHAGVSSKASTAMPAAPAAPAITRSARKRKVDSAQPVSAEAKPAPEPLTRRRASSAIRRPAITASASSQSQAQAQTQAPAPPVAPPSVKNRRRTLAAETPSRRAPVPPPRTPPTTRSAKRTKRA
ncbi:antigen identified by monoclonal antibody Ki-67 [Coemansia erecta]|uniref:Antigen identified by monoclonal antibody Ki-67 n=1 Tax=Coemansia erecta TaxID=147472 RepID=A0A9W7Y4N2_9FUNG|nr:antigen identified by monoclonal antibody Ki-67 [Coemansia erecta]